MLVEKKAIFGRPNFDSNLYKLCRTIKRYDPLAHAKAYPPDNTPSARSARILRPLLGCTLPITTLCFGTVRFAALPLWPLGVEQSFWTVGDLLEAAA